jgi:ABC-type transport system involved in cytochrome bd biosynthesis fused ATPase/permease subunit
VVGDIGSGKSSLLYAILNEMTPEPEKDPKITINGSIAYSPQKAWIMSGTVRENIVFGQTLDTQRLNDAIYYACLTDDLQILSKGLDTEIGEKGTNLSGGQKTRISLARTLYSGRDIYLFDDILSAVDVHVGKFIMEKTILGYLKGKTVIMPTHAIKYFDKADFVVVMKKGRVVASGGYKQVSGCEAFQEIMKTEQKKDQEASKQSREEESIVNELKVVKEVSQHKEQKSNAPSSTEPSSHTDKLIEQLILA